MAKKNERTKGNSGKRASNQKASSLAVNTSKKIDRTGVVAGCVPRKNRRPRARHPPASPASPEKIKSPEKSPGRPRPRVSSPLSNKRKKVSRAQREKRPSQVTATPPAGLKKSGLKRPPRHTTANTGLKPVSTVPSSSPTKKNRGGRNNNKRARLPPRRATAKNTDKLTTVTNGAVTKKKTPPRSIQEHPRRPDQLHAEDHSRLQQPQEQGKTGLVSRVPAPVPTRRRRRTRAPPQRTNRHVRHAPAKVREAHTVEMRKPRAVDGVQPDARRFDAGQGGVVRGQPTGGRVHMPGGERECGSAGVR